MCCHYLVIFMYTMLIASSSTNFHFIEKKTILRGIGIFLTYMLNQLVLMTYTEWGRFLQFYTGQNCELNWKAFECFYL